MTDPIRPAVEVVRPKDMLEAIGELAMAIKPHNSDSNQRRRIAEAIGVLVDAVLATAIIEADRAAIRADERAMIVAWLRERAARIKPIPTIGDDDSIYLYDYDEGLKAGLHNAADAIESGEHMGGEDGTD